MNRQTVRQSPAAQSVARVAAALAQNEGITVEAAMKRCIDTALKNPEAMPPFVRQFLAEFPQIARSA